jgi:uncharacterized protein
LITVKLAFDNHGCLKRLEATGHAELAARGYDILCAAVTVLIRTTAKIIHANRSIQSTGSKAYPGLMQFEIVSYKQEQKDWMRGVTDFCVTGLQDLMYEYPERVLIKNSNE